MSNHQSDTDGPTPIMSFYGTDLAYIHHVAFSELSRAAAPWLIAQLASSGRADGRVVDLGCGTGVLAAELTQCGYDVVGVDISRAMIAVARKTAPRARFVVGSLFGTPMPPCRAVTAVGEVLSYGVVGKGSSLSPLFNRVYRALEPGGFFFFDILDTTAATRLVPGRHHRQGPDWAVLTEVERHRIAHRLIRRITAFRKRGHTYRRTSETHTLRLYSGAEVARQLRDVGFRVRRLPGYGETRLLASRVGFVARK